MQLLTRKKRNGKIRICLVWSKWKVMTVMKYKMSNCGKWKTIAFFSSPKKRNEQILKQEFAWTKADYSL